MEVMQDNDDDCVMLTNEIKNTLHTEVIGQNILYFQQLESTNTYCRQNGTNLPDGTVVIANNQTAGKGSRGRRWESPKDVAIYMSLLLKPDMEPVYAPRLTPVMALSVARALRELGIEVQIKWPNDIVFNGRKLVGILTEMRARSTAVEQVVIGVGINVSTKQFPKELKYRATSLYMETGKDFSREEIIGTVMNYFEEDYRTFLKTFDLSQLLEQYIQFSATVGKEVRILDARGEYTGIAMDVDANGQLIVQKEDGQLVPVYADEVSVRGIYGYI